MRQSSGAFGHVRAAIMCRAKTTKEFLTELKIEFSNLHLNLSSGYFAPIAGTDGFRRLLSASQSSIRCGQPLMLASFERLPMLNP